MKYGSIRFSFDKDLLLRSPYHTRKKTYTIEQQKKQAFIAIAKLNKQQKKRAYLWIKC